jgi:hypothetical protein
MCLSGVQHPTFDTVFRSDGCSAATRQRITAIEALIAQDEATAADFKRRLQAAGLRALYRSDRPLGNGHQHTTIATDVSQIIAENAS